MTPDVPGPNLTVPALASKFHHLHTRCGEIMQETLADGNLATHSRAVVLLEDLGIWLDLLATRPEEPVLRMATCEYDFALAALTHGHYRHAFMGLRLTLELGLCTVHYSTHLLELKEWLNGDRDVNWHQLTESDSAVLSARCSKAFFPALQDRTQHYNRLARNVYRDCSQYVHANPSSTHLLPDSLKFDSASFINWHQTADAVGMVVIFALSLRYALTLSHNDRDVLETSILARLGHISELRVLFGGVPGE
jgi:hypothetical protein